jgi:hypothetical protein
VADRRGRRDREAREQEEEDDAGDEEVEHEDHAGDDAEDGQHAPRAVEELWLAPLHSAGHLGARRDARLLAAPVGEVPGDARAGQHLDVARGQHHVTFQRPRDPHARGGGAHIAAHAAGELHAPGGDPRHTAHARRGGEPDHLGGGEQAVAHLALEPDHARRHADVIEHAARDHEAVRQDHEIAPDQSRHRHRAGGGDHVRLRLAGKVDLSGRGVDVARMIPGEHEAPAGFLRAGGRGVEREEEGEREAPGHRRPG